MADDPGKKLQMVMSVLGPSTDESFALSILESVGWDVQQAVAVLAPDEVPGALHATASVPHAHANAGAAATTAANDDVMLAQETVRAPDRTKRQRLSDDSYCVREAGAQPLQAAFRDFGAEARGLALSVGSGAGGGAGAGIDGSSAPGSAGNGRRGRKGGGGSRRGRRQLRRTHHDAAAAGTGADHVPDAHASDSADSTQQYGANAAINACPTSPLSPSLSRAPVYEPSPQSRTLGEIYAPPLEILFRGDFESARRVARQLGKWLLINLQAETEFASHQLNSDTWTDETVKEVVKLNFVMWQQDGRSGHGQRFADMYDCDRSQLPMICIVDPRTGWKETDPRVNMTGFVAPDVMIERLMDYCDKHPPPPPEATAEAATAAEAEAETAGSASASAVNPADAKGVVAAAAGGGNDLDLESRQLAQALAESAKQSQLAAPASASAPAPPAKTTPDDHMVPPSSTATAAAATATPAESAINTPLPALPPEPAAGNASARIQLRLPAGKRLQRRFAPDDKIAVLWSLLSSGLQAADEDAPNVHARELAQYELGMPAMPGQAPLRLRLLQALEDGTTFEQAGLLPSASLSVSR